MAVHSLVRQIREEWEIHGRDWTQPGFRALAVYRFGVWLRREVRGGLFRAALSRLHRSMYRYVRNHYGIELPVTTVVGRRVVIGHQSGIVIHPRAVIGDECLIRQNVTIGAASHDRSSEAPKLGRGVHVGCGAAILGPVTIGDGARIGPNAVVTTDVPAGASVFVDAPRIILMKKAPVNVDSKPDSRVAESRIA
jgi:serine O-acetyltransferase